MISEMLESCDLSLPGEPRTRLVLVDDHHEVRQCLVELFALEPCIEVVGQAGDGQEALGLVRRLQPDVVVMDIEMPQMDGIEATRCLCDEFPQMRIIGLSMHDHKAEAMLAAGATLFLRKDGPPDSLLAAICE